MSSTGNKRVSEINETIAAELAKINADAEKFSGGASAAAKRIRSSYMAIAKVCKEGRKVVQEVSKEAREARKANKGNAKVPNRQLK